ncbi:COG1361 S-layer family protein [Clostridium thermarum]|uniref:COG1361 S-layer family protein n=1 Tax=Clostridium thermarum TaxID=1716543 RepID=UPI00111D61E4|nr:hypothetical protein [Clostridium thermarum]
MKKLLHGLLIITFICFSVIGQPIARIAIAAPEGNDITVDHSVVQNGSNTIYKGEFKLRLILNNENKAILKNVSVQINSSGDSSFSVTRGSSIINIGDFDPEKVSISSDEITLIYDGQDNTRLPIKVRYTKVTPAGGSEGEDSSTELEINTYLAINAVPNSSIKDPTPTDTSKYVPKLSVVSSSLPTGKPGETLTIPVQIKNTSYYHARNISVTPQFTEDSPFEVNALTTSQTISSLSPDSTWTANFNLKISFSAANKVYPLKLKFEFENYYNDSYTSETTIYVKVAGTASDPTSSKLMVKSFSWSAAAVTPGSSTDLSIVLANIGNASLKDIKLSLLGLKEEGFTVTGTSTSTFITSLDAGRETTVRFTLNASKSMTTGNYPIAVKLEYKEGSSKEVTTDEQQFFIPVEAGNLLETNSKLVIKDFSLSTTPVSAGGSTVLTIGLANIGNTNLSDVKISLLGLKEDGFTVVGSSASSFFTRLTAGQTTKVNFKLTASSKMTSGNYGIGIKLECKDGFSKEALTDEQQFFIPVVGKDAPEQTGKTVPKIILDQYSSNPTIVKAGENFELSMTFYNTSETKAVRNIKIFLTANESTTEGGNIFTPVNSSNTFYIDSIAPKGKVNKTLTLYTIPDAKQKTYTLTANLEYEDAEGTEYKATDLIGIPVAQDTKIETSEITLPPEAYAYQPFYVAFDFYNTGKTMLRNLMIKTEGDFDLQNASYFVGNFDVGSSDHYEAMVTPRAAGQVQGAVVISFEDPTGQKTEIRKDFTMNVMDMPVMPEPGMDPGMDPGVPVEGENKSILANPLVWSGAGVVVLAIIGLIVKKRITKKREAMTLDE